MSESRPKMSVIISVYSVEKYLRAYLDSISGQTLREIAHLTFFSIRRFRRPTCGFTRKGKKPF